MEVKIITKQQYDEYLKNTHQGNFWQSQFYFDAKIKQGQEVIFVGGYKNHILCAVGGLLVYPSVLGKKIYRCPRGFLLDYHDKALVQDFFNGVKKLLKKYNGLYVRFDPYVEYQERDLDGNLVEDGISNKSVVDNLLSIGCKHRGFYTGYDVTGEPRWMFVLDLKDKDKEKLRSSFSQQTKRSIQKAEKSGVKVRELAKEELSIFVQVMEHTEERKGFGSPTLEYYENMFDAGKEHVKFLVAELDFKEYKDKLEKEKSKYENDLEDIEKKIVEQVSDKKLQKKKRIEESLNLTNKKLKEVEHEEGIKPLAVAMFSTFGNEVLYLFGGAYDTYMKFSPQYLIQWTMISYAIDNHYDIYNFYGISGNFDVNDKDYGVYRFKKGFQGRVVELIGDFEFVISPLLCAIYNFIKSIRVS